MKEYPEELLHYVWKYALYNPETLTTTEGEPIEVIFAGNENKNAGPDFTEAKIKIGNYTWAGNIEIHTHSSEWYSHKHNTNPQYNNVILHIVSNHNIDKQKHPDYNIKTAIIQINKNLEQQYLALKNSKHFIPCTDYVKEIHSFAKFHMIQRTAIERLQQKSTYISTIFNETLNNWNETFYIILSRYFGTSVNKNAFEQLAKNIPLKILAKHKTNLLQIEALLFGVAGFLQTDKDNYQQQLKQEWEFLSKKYSLESLPLKIWKFLRIRPANFPTIRIAQLAKLIYQSTFLFSKILENPTPHDITKLLDTSIDGYWKHHYNFGKKTSKNKTTHTGQHFINTLIINAVVPTLFTYGTKNQDSGYKEKALSLLDSMPAENNRIIKEYEKLHFPVESALNTQGLLQLKENYCSKIKCLNCIVGNKILKKQTL